MISEPIDAVRAQELGLVNKVVPLDALEDEANKLAERLAGAADQGLRRNQGADQPQYGGKAASPTNCTPNRKRFCAPS